jgi:hypothetical protein
METNPYILENQNLFKRNPEFLQLVEIFRYEMQHAQRPKEELLLDDVDLQKMLKVSRRTTANYRAQGLLTYYTIGGKIFYKWGEVLRDLEKNKVPSVSSKLKF